MRTDVGAACGAMMIALGLGGCVSHTWVAGQDVHATFEEQSAQCRMLARQGASGFYASGSPGYVTGVAIGNAIGNAIQANADFNDCMVANGWEAADQQETTPIVTAIPQTSTATALVPGPLIAPTSAVPAPAPVLLTPCGETRPCSIETVTVNP
jgi:hypothetical protein